MDGSWSREWKREEEEKKNRETLYCEFSGVGWSGRRVDLILSKIEPKTKGKIRAQLEKKNSKHYFRPLAARKSMDWLLIVI